MAGTVLVLQKEHAPAIISQLLENLENYVIAGNSVIWFDRILE